MSELWEYDNSSGADAAADSEDWAEESDSEPSSGGRKGRKRRRTAVKQVFTVQHDEGEQQQPKQQEDEDDPFAGVLGNAKLQSPAKKIRETSPQSCELLDGDPDVESAQISSRRAAIAQCRVDTSVLDVKTRQAAEQTRELKEQLKQLGQLGEQEFESDELELPSQSPAKVQQQPDDDINIVDDDSEDMSLPAAAAAADGANGAPADEGKLSLNFKTQGCEDVTVLVVPHEPLQAALDKFRQYVRTQGWGSVSRFEFDGDKLTGEESAQDLGLDTDDIIEVYVQ